MGQLWDMYEGYLKRHEYTPSQRQVAERLGMSATAFGNWRHGLERLPSRRNLLAFADLIGVSYPRVVDAALVDAKYLPENVARDANRLAASVDRIKRATSVDESNNETA